MSTIAVILIALIGLTVLKPTDRQLARASASRRDRKREHRTAIRELGLLRR